MLCPRFSSSRAGGRRGGEPRGEIRPPSPIPRRAAAGLGAVLPSTGAGAGGREPRGRGPSELPERERRRPGARGGRRRAGQRRYGSPRRPPMLPAGPAAATAAGVSAKEAAAAATPERKEESGEERGRGRQREREEGETAPREINHHMTVAIRRRPPTAGAYAGEPGKSCEERTHL